MNGMRRTALVASCLVAGVAIGAAGALMLKGGSGAAPAITPSAAPKYRCPMHPTMVSDRPGDCPICQMRMVPIESAAAEPAAAPAPPPRRKVVYRSTMNPSEVSDHPGKDSMGMEMEPVEIEEPVSPAGPGAAGRATVRISEQKRQLIGVRTGPVTKSPFVRTLRTVGRVVYDERRLHHVHTKVAGWIETLYANATGELVKQGQPLLTLYSPELLATAQEYLLALKTRERLAGASLPSVREGGEELVASARRRLLLFDLTPKQIADLESKGEAPRTMTLYAPVSGYVTARNVLAGEKIEAGTNLLDIADLNRVWILADVYEYELPFVHVGQKAEVTLAYLPGRALEGRVDLIYPVLSETTRTVKVRLAFDNPDLSLKPDMYADVAIAADLGERLMVPDSAVIATGERDIVFVDRGDGYFEPREVKLGLRLPDSAEVLSGLAVGEVVLTSGNFFIDSESKLEAALSAAAGPGAPGHAH